MEEYRKGKEEGKVKSPLFAIFHNKKMKENGERRKKERAGEGKEKEKIKVILFAILHNEKRKENLKKQEDTENRKSS